MYETGGPVIRHLDDVPEEETVRVRYKDGRTASIYEKWIEVRPRYIAFWNRWEPGAVSPQHGHTGDHINLILKGEIRCGDVVCRAGTHIMLDWGNVFGPWVAGPEGCELYGFIAGEGAAFIGSREAYDALLKELGCEVVPVETPRALPYWLRVRNQNSGLNNWKAEAVG